MIRALLFLLLLAASPLAAAEIAVAVRPGVKVDDAGVSLRRALNAWEAAAADPLPRAWSRATLRRGESRQLGAGTFVLYGGPASSTPLLVVDGAGPHSGTLETGKEQTLGTLRVIYLFGSPNGDSADLLLRTAAEPPQLSDAAPARSAAKITGYDSPPEIRVASADARLLDFARQFLEAFDGTRTPEEAADLAWKVAPPAQDLGSGSVAQRAPSDYLDPTNFDQPSGDDWVDAVVTIRLVRSDSASLKALLSDLSYDSEGGDPGNPRVRASGGGDGADVRIGSRGDRFEARLRALEASGGVNVESETLLRVPVGGFSAMSLAGPTGAISADVAVQPAGRRGVYLELRHLSGDCGFLGAVSSRVRVADGRTVALAKNSYSRTSHSRSGVPLAGSLPFVGPAFRNEVGTTESSSYALFASVELE